MLSVNDAFQTLSRAVAAISLFFIVYDLFTFGLTPISEALLQFWRTYVQDVLVRFFKIFEINISRTSADIISLYISLGYCNIRRQSLGQITEGLRVTRMGQRRRHEIGILGRVLFILFSSALWPIVIIFNLTYPAVLAREGMPIFEQLKNPMLGCYIRNFFIFIEEVVILLLAFSAIFIVNYAYL